MPAPCSGSAPTLFSIARSRPSVPGISLRAARGLMRRERRRSPRKPVSSSANVAYPGAPELNAGAACEG